MQKKRSELVNALDMLKDYYQASWKNNHFLETLEPVSLNYLLGKIETEDTEHIYISVDSRFFPTANGIEQYFKDPITAAIAKSEHISVELYSNSPQVEREIGQHLQNQFPEKKGQMVGWQTDELDNPVFFAGHIPGRRDTYKPAPMPDQIIYGTFEDNELQYNAYAIHNADSLMGETCGESGLFTIVATKISKNAGNHVYTKNNVDHFLTL